jgi:hypothetical protein
VVLRSMEPLPWVSRQLLDPGWGMGQMGAPVVCRLDTLLLGAVTNQTAKSRNLCSHGSGIAGLLPSKP